MPMIIPPGISTTNQSGGASEEEESASPKGVNGEITIHTIQARVSARVHRGTNRPSGNTYVTIGKHPRLAPCRNMTGSCQIGWALISGASSGVTVSPTIANHNETNRAIRSTDLCQKIRAAAVVNTSEKIAMLAVW